MQYQQHQQHQAQAVSHQVIEQLTAKVNELIQKSDLTQLTFNQQQQILDQYRVNIYTLELKVDLLIKMMEEKGVWAKDEFNKRWPLYLKNDVGIIGQDGKMQGEMKVTFYGN